MKLEDIHCCICGDPLGSPFYGAGDGSGDKFACELCWLRKRIKELETELDKTRVHVTDLESFRGDIMAGCDIQKGTRLYRQVLVDSDGRTESERDLSLALTFISNIPGHQRDQTNRLLAALAKAREYVSCDIYTGQAWSGEAKRLYDDICSIEAPVREMHLAHEDAMNERIKELEQEVKNLREQLANARWDLTP